MSRIGFSLYEQFFKFWNIYYDSYINGFIQYLNPLFRNMFINFKVLFSLEVYLVNILLKEFLFGWRRQNLKNFVISVHVILWAFHVGRTQKQLGIVFGAAFVCGFIKVTEELFRYLADSLKFNHLIFIYFCNQNRAIESID